MFFGKDITQLYGPNGCGKTPVIHSIAFAIGYPVKYRDDILENCQSVILKVEHEGNEITFIREIGTKFNITCKQSSKVEQDVFYNEKDFTGFLLDLLDTPVVTLTSNRNEAVSPYVSTLLPLFYVDQDSGYTSAYRSPSSFIKDQYSEMIRLILGVPPKHSYENKRHLIEKKAKLDTLNVSIVNKENFIQMLSKQAGARIRSKDDIEFELQTLRNQIDELRSNRDAISDTESIFDNLINNKLNEKREIELRIRDIESRIQDFSKIKNEIEIEINTLSLNEESRRVFSSFSDICSNNGCQLFLSSSESYAKSLLYLRDQIKDLDRNTKYQQIRLDELKNLLHSTEKEIGRLKSKSSKSESESETSGLISTISEITRSIIDLQAEKEVVDRVNEENTTYLELLNKRERLQNDIASLEGTRSGKDLRVLDFRTKFKDRIAHWLDVLSTKNVSRDITVDQDFNILFGSEKLSQFSGSTLLRVVLAIKSAFFEISLNFDSNAIEFMIFDTPRQHDIESNHFARFIGELKELVKDKRAQVIFSTTEYHYENDKDDIEWAPCYGGFEQLMMLGIEERYIQSMK
ncbi:MAG: hypothetical protein HWE07_12180 [Cytophagia bacterium]|nr:hypothetical protein [Cytophagia bacterium]